MLGPTYGGIHKASSEKARKWAEELREPPKLEGITGLLPMVGPLAAVQEGYEHQQKLRSNVRRFRAYRKMGRDTPAIFTAARHVSNQLLTAIPKIRETDRTSEAAVELIERALGVGEEKGAGRCEQSLETILGEFFKAHLYGFGLWSMEAEFEDGKYWIRKLHYRQPDTIVGWVVDERQEWVAAIQRVGLKAAILPRNETVKLVQYPTEGGLTGVGLFRPIYGHWLDIQDSYKQAAVARQRYATGTPHAHLDEEVAKKFGLSTKDHLEAERNEMRTLLSRYEGHEESHLITFPWWKLDVYGGKQTYDPEPLQKSAAYHERIIAEQFFAAHLMLGRQGSGGTYNLSETQAGISERSIINLADWIFEALNRQVVQRILRWNFGDALKPEEMPVIGYEGLKAEGWVAHLEKILSGYSTGVLTYQTEDEVAFRAGMDMPAMNKETLERSKTKARAGISKNTPDGSAQARRRQRTPAASLVKRTPGEV